MPLHNRKIPDSITKGCETLIGLSREIFSDLDPLNLNSAQSQSSRISLATTTLHVVMEQAESVAALVLQHRNEVAAPILRTMMEAYTRLVYILLGDGEHRLAALAYADVLHQIKDMDMVAMDYKKHDKAWPKEAQMYTPEFRSNLRKRQAELRIAKDHYWSYLSKQKPKEYFQDGDLEEGALLKKLTLSKLASRVDYEKKKLGENANARVNYSMVYGQLSKYIHASTLYLSSLTSIDRQGNIRINTVSEEENEEDSLRSLYTAYGLLADTYLEVLKELDRKTDEKRLSYVEAATSITDSLNV